MLSMPLLLLQTPPDVAQSAENYFALGMQMMNMIESSVIGAINTAIGGSGLLTLVLGIMGGIFAIHFMEGLVKGVHTGSMSGLTGGVMSVLWEKLPRILVFFVIAMTALPMSTGGMALYQRAAGVFAPLNDETAGTIVGTWMQFLGSGGTKVVTDEDGNQYTISKAPPPVANLIAASRAASQAIEGLTYAKISAKTDDEIRKAIERSKQNAAGSVTNLGGEVGIQEIVGAAVDEIMDLVLSVAFAAAQYAMAKGLLLQTLFVKLSWYVALQFLPVFILLAYFRPLQSFVVNLLQHFVVLSVTCMIVGAVAQPMYDPATWCGDNGIIHQAFAGAKFDTTNAWSPGSLPWFTARYAKAVGIAQITFLLGATGVILTQVFGVVSGVVGGSFRSVFTGAGSSGSSTVFGGS